MISLVPACPEMAMLIVPQEAQVATGQIMTSNDLAHAIKSGLALAAVSGSRILGIGGVSEEWADRGTVWSIVADGIGRDMVHVHRCVARTLAVCPLRRIEAHVASAHEAGHRWIRMLGFEHEGTMRAFYQGHDFDLYARVR